MLPEILGERGWNTYMVGKWHLCPDRRDEPRLDAAELADRPWLRALVRVPRRRDEPVVSRSSSTTTTPSTSRRSPEEGYHFERGHHRQGDRVHHGRQGGRAGEAVLPLLRARRLPRAAPRAEGVDRRSTGAASTWATRRCARQTLARQKELGIVPPDTELPPINPIGTPETRTGPGRAAVPAAGRHPAVGLAVGRREAAVLPDGRGVRRVPRARRRPDRPPARTTSRRTASARTR